MHKKEATPNSVPINPGHIIFAIFLTTFSYQLYFIQLFPKLSNLNRWSFPYNNIRIGKGQKRKLFLVNIYQIHIKHLNVKFDLIQIFCSFFFLVYLSSIHTRFFFFLINCRLYRIDRVIIKRGESFRGVVANMLDCNTQDIDFEPQSRYYVHVRTNIL